MEQTGPIRNLLRRLNNGLLVILKPLQIVNNFLFLAVAYFVGVGFSSLLYRLGPGKKIRPSLPQTLPEGAEALKTGASPDSPDSYWRPVTPSSRDRGHWLRPF